MRKLTPRERVKKAMIKLLSTHPFFGYVLYQIPVIFEDEPRPRGPRIVVTPEFVEEINDNELIATLVHEELHYLLGHATRTQLFKKKMRANMSEEERERFDQLMNIAEDVVINTILEANGFVVPGRAIRPYIDASGNYVVTLKDSEGKTVTLVNPHRMSAEEVYHEIKDLKLKTNEEGPKTAWLETDGENEQTTVGDEQEKAKEGSGTLSPEELTSRALNYSKLAGTTPAGFERLIDELAKPKLDLLPYVRRFLVKVVPSDYTYLRPARNSPPDVFLPDVERKPHVRGMVAIDTSGSMDERELSKCLSELINFAKNNSLQLTVVTCDADIQDVYENVTSAKLLKNLKLKGGGGTDFRPVFELAEKKKAKFLVYFTDGYGLFPKKTRIPTLWVLTPNGTSENNIPFGKVVRMI